VADALALDACRLIEFSHAYAAGSFHISTQELEKKTARGTFLLNKKAVATFGICVVFYYC
jgi:hypothetical protein